MRDFINKSKDSVMLRHVTEKHINDVTESKFKMRVTETYGDDCLLRQVAEGVKINRTPDDKLINNKSEFNQARLPRTVVTLA